MIVLDASAAVDWLLQTPAGQRIEERIYARKDTLHTVHLLDVEFAQVLRRLVREGTLARKRAEEAIEDLIAVRLTRYAPVLLLNRIWQLRPEDRRCPRSCGHDRGLLGERPSPKRTQPAAIIPADRIEQLGNSFACCGFYRVAQLGKGVAPPGTHGVGLLQIRLSVRTVFFVGLKAAVPQPAQVANTADLSGKAVVPVLVAVDPIGSLGEGLFFHGLANLAGS
jgi:hypothetical protein